MSEKSTIIKGAIISYVSIFINIGITLIYTPWMIHQVGISDYGLYGLTTSFLSYFLLDFGLSGTITRFIARYRAEGREDKVENLLGLTAKVYIIFDSIIFLTLFVLYFFLSQIFDSGLTTSELDRLKILYCIAGTFSVLNFLFKPVSGAMNAYELFVENKLLDLIIRVGSVLLIIIALLLGGDVFAIVFVNGAIGFIVAWARFIIFRKKTKVHINWGYFSKNDLLDLTSFSVWVLVNSIATMLRLGLVPTILGITSNTTQISVFTVGRHLEGFVYTISTALNGLFLPKVTRMSLASDRRTINELLIRVGRIQLIIISLIYSGFCVFGLPFMDLWVGPEFRGSYYVFICLVFVNLVSLTLQIAMDLVYAENRIKDTSIIVFTTSFLGVILSFLVSRQYGAVGCALASGLAMILTYVLYIWYFHRKMNLDMKTFFANCHLRILPLIIVYAIVSFLIFRNLSVHNWLALFLSISVYSIGFLLLVYLFIINYNEKQMMREIIHKIFKH